MAKPVLLALSLALSLVPLAAEADKDRGSSGGGGGRLGQVSSGLGRATGGGGSSGGNSSERYDRFVDRDRYDYGEPVVVTGAGGVRVVRPPRPSPPVKVDFYAGAQKVHDSDGSLSLELAFNDGRFRLGGSITRYFEQQEDADALTLTIPTLYIGYRIDDGGPTRAYLEVGAVGARTRNDPVMNSSVGGVLGGVRVEHRVSRRISVVGDAQVMAFEKDVRGAAARAGISYRHVQATLRYLDLNVGPALFGPEVGIRF